MNLNYGLKTLWRHGIYNSTLARRALHHDGRNRLTNFWTPTQTKRSPSPGDSAEDGHDLLVRAGFLRQAHSGIFHLLPLGLRVQDKLERLIDKHMQSLGASKVSLSSISSQELWRKSGRLEGRDSELFQLQDRKDAKYLLSPTHEEEITNIVKDAVHSYKDLPLRLYQVSRKYRDEARPRQGLLRGREFVMKDLYTFDLNEENAMRSYEDARTAYRGFLDELNIPYLVANADSGNMGGNHSHEYHVISTRGEDTIISCKTCNLCINEELYAGRYESEKNNSGLDSPSYGTSERDSSDFLQVWYGRIPDSTPSQNSAKLSDAATLLQVFLPGPPFELNPHALKKLFPGVNTGEPIHPDMVRGHGSKMRWTKVVSLRDPRVPLQDIFNNQIKSGAESTTSLHAVEEAPFLLTKARPEDSCPGCGTSGSLHMQHALEIGHTFHLGKRYSTPLEAMVKNEHNEVVEMQMGCHGIGVSRLMGAVASLLADSRGLNWPVSIAPFSALVLGAGRASMADVHEVYDHISIELGAHADAVIDDRERPFGWKLNDADLIGYPFIIILGKAWEQRRAVELQCRRLGLKEEVPYEELVQQLRNHTLKL